MTTTSFLGVTSLNRLIPPGNNPGDDGQPQRSKSPTRFLRRWVCRGSNRRWLQSMSTAIAGHLMEDAQTPDSDVVKSIFQMTRMAGFTKCNRGLSSTGAAGQLNPVHNAAWCALNPYHHRGDQEAGPLSLQFQVRRTPVSANDFTNVFSLVDAACSPGSPSFVANLEDIAT